MTDNNDSDSDSEDDSVVAQFTAVDFSGVNFDVDHGADGNAATEHHSEKDRKALSLERDIAFGIDNNDITKIKDKNYAELDNVPEAKSPNNLKYIGECLASGNYAAALRSSDVARDFFSARAPTPGDTTTKVSSWIRQQMFTKCNSIIDCIEYELLGVAALNLFLQANYVGPAIFGEDKNNNVLLEGINPHPCFTEILSSHSDGTNNNASSQSNEKEEEKQDNINTKLTEPKRNVKYQNAVLSELAVDGEWPCQVCIAPYFLLLARSILSTLAANPSKPNWTYFSSTSNSNSGSSDNNDDNTVTAPPPSSFLRYAGELQCAKLWCGRSAVAHERLLQTRQPTVTLWNEVEEMYQRSIDAFCPQSDDDTPTSCVDRRIADRNAAAVMLEWGLAQHHFDRPGMGKKAFIQAQKYSGLLVEVTGAEGKRTKFQTKATAQMLVKATSAQTTATTPNKPDAPAMQSNSGNKDLIQGQMVEHGEDGVLLERIKFEDDKENVVTELNTLDQAILLSLCLDVKNNNPADGLTAEEMGAYLSRVLDHHDDWMVYSTALLERAWLEFERSHARERAIMQMQALADQHTERLTITQSTRDSIEDSAPVQERLRMLHCIVYPPRWSMIQDLADRYSSLGVVTSAAELYTEVELWDDVVDCYKRAEKLPLAEKIVRERLEVQETPRMYKQLGDLTDDPQYYKRAIELSKGRFSDAYVALGAYYFEKSDLSAAADNFKCALKVRPLAPRSWFRLGTISMQLERWDDALRAFSEVVQQDPEEAEAWANVAAIHMRNKHPAEAYPALVESLRYNRNNWRIWVSKLYTCLDLKKYDEAVQACTMLIDLRTRRQTATAQGIPPLEEKCVRAIVGGAIKSFKDSQGDDAALESSRRTLTRVSTLLHQIKSSSDVEPWVFETLAFFHEQVGQDEKVLVDLNQEYRSLTQIQGWEKEDGLVVKVCGVVSQIVDIHMGEENRESLTKAKFLARGVVKRIQTARSDDPKIPVEVMHLEASLRAVEEKLQLLKG